MNFLKGKIYIPLKNEWEVIKNFIELRKFSLVIHVVCNLMKWSPFEVLFGPSMCNMWTETD